jgi:hypothetical protein
MLAHMGEPVGSIDCSGISCDDCGWDGFYAAMRILIASVALWLGAHGAMADDMCSDGFGKPAKLSAHGEEGSLRYILKIGDKAESFEYGGSVGTGLNGFQLVPKEGDVEVVNTADVTSEVISDKPDTIVVWLFRDRVFWPCD